MAAKRQIRAVIEPRRLLPLQLAMFLGIAMSWQLPAPSLGAASPWQPPLIGSKLINSYLAPETAYSAGHRGVDYEVSLGQGVFAPADGSVHFVGKVVNRQLITLSHEGSLLSSFEPVCSNLELGQKVATGDLIGEICEGDSSYTPHCLDEYCLHFSARKNGEHISPLWLTGELSPSRLLPWIEID